MKKLSIIVCLLLGMTATYAQHQVNSFFDAMGMAKIQTTEYSSAHDTIVTVEHRMDDVIWSRVVYRVIDMRYKQNFQLYFPTKPDDPNYRNLLKIIADAIVDGMPIYEKNVETIRPNDFKVTPPMEKEQVPMAYFIEDPLADYTKDETHFDIAESSDMLLHYDSIEGTMEVNTYAFEALTKNQIKYLIQEVVFFDKHNSRLFSKIMAIAPLNADLIRTQDNVMTALRESITFWVPFDALRPYLAKQFVIPSQNETKRLTFDDFFQKRLYTSYIVGEGNLYNRFIPEYSVVDGDVQKEQARIENELLTFEQDLWEY
ncbi:MAG: gliding motility protein GldN [Paludibacteraceae bacterium]|nr:gliding motility protein GldN [Paludibacteraceae bacterium]